ncbi:MAG: hypothetical protein J6K03_00860 [Oscillospiraceae bacterium]|nr:hypothetical protein [Oscillospiraceae bacterium]
MKKKLLWCAGIIILLVLVILGVCRWIEVRNRQTDPNWKLAEQIYNMENALKEVDEDYECQSISKVTPFTYTDSEGNKIVYYCCQTTYIEDEYGENTVLNTDAIGMVIDFAQIQNRRDCKVNAYDAFRCEMGERSYLCWTISPEVSCVIEYSADTIAEADIFRMAKSIQLPE